MVQYGDWNNGKMVENQRRMWVKLLTAQENNCACFGGMYSVCGCALVSK